MICDDETRCPSDEEPAAGPVHRAWQGDLARRCATLVGGHAAPATGADWSERIGAGVAALRHARSVLRTFSSAQPLGVDDFDAALEICATGPAMNAFVAARLLEGGPACAGSVLGVRSGHRLRSICWAAANVVPVAADADALDAYASRLRRHRRRCSSIFGDAEQVLPLWERLKRHWGMPRSVRPEQPLLAVSSPPLADGRVIDPRVRVARPDEVDLVLPAAAHMFTEEIGYPPYLGSDREYRRLVTSLVERGHTYVIVDDAQVVFKADIGSLAGGVAQIQGVWVAPARRGKGLATPAMNAVVQHVLDFHASTVTLYVNGYNEAARRTYAAAGFRQIGTFATIIL